MCQANLIDHWLDGAKTPAERQRREDALESIAQQKSGVAVYDGPALLRLVQEWSKDPVGINGICRACDEPVAKHIFYARISGLVVICKY